MTPHCGGQREQASRETEAPEAPSFSKEAASVFCPFELSFRG